MINAEDMVRVPRPDFLDAIRAHPAGTIEASAGTGKTHLLVHLVVDLILDGIPVEDILVVTFTEKATHELAQRLRAKLTELATASETRATTVAATAASATYWTLDAQADLRIRRALLSLDRATLSTIHGFCQRISGEFAFLHGLLFEQERVPARLTFHQVFRDWLRENLVSLPEARDGIPAWFGLGESIESLEQLLYEAHETSSQGTMLDPPWDKEALTATHIAWAALDPDGVLPAKLRGIHPNTLRALRERLRTFVLGAREREGQPFAFLRSIDENSGSIGQKDLFVLLRALPVTELAPGTARAIRLLLDHAVPLSAALVHAFLPGLAARVERTKRHTGCFDFQDLLSRVAVELDGPNGPALVERLRARYRAAVIDEFQDTDPVQWHIFKRIFADSGGRNLLYLIGDPKQAIYDFRGANVTTYLHARDTLARSGNPIHALTHNFRSTPALLQVLNRLCVGRNDVPESGLFTVGTIRATPVTPGRPKRSLVDHLGQPLAPLHLLTVETETTNNDAAPIFARVAEVRAVLAARIATEIATLLANPPALHDEAGQQIIGARDIFVLARNGAECETVADALAAQAIPHAVWREQSVFKSEEAAWVRRLLSALAAPFDQTRRFAALSSGLFGADLETLLNEPQLLSDTALHTVFLQLAELGRRRDYDALFSAILRESSVLCRNLALGGSATVRANVLHVLETLRQDIGHSRPTLHTVLRLLDERIVSEHEEDKPRLPTEQSAVQVMTIHKSKGLEAAIVFLFGGLHAFRGKTYLSTYEDARGIRRAYIGNARTPELRLAIARQRAAEEQRLCYVALTRAKGRLYLPYFPALETGEDSDVPDRDTARATGPRKLDGTYRHINRILHHFVSDSATSSEYTSEPMEIPARARTSWKKDMARTPTAAASPNAPSATKAAWPPVPVLPSTELAELAHLYAGPKTTSYSRMKRRLVGDSTEVAGLPAVVLDETNLVVPMASNDPTQHGDEHDALPGGTRTGIFLHEVLERLPLAAVRARPLPDDWHRRGEAARVFDAALSRHGLKDTARDSAAQLVATALTRTLPLSADGSLAPLPGLASLDDPGTLLRETPFLCLGPAGISDFVSGVLDVVFRVSHTEERVFALDWKSDLLPPGTTPAAHVAEHYGLQVRLYVSALVRALGIRDARSHADRFGGMLYVFLREPGPHGVVFLRPDWPTLERWLTET